MFSSQVGVTLRSDCLSFELSCIIVAFKFFQISGCLLLPSAITRSLSSLSASDYGSTATTATLGCCFVTLFTYCFTLTGFGSGNAAFTGRLMMFEEELHLLKAFTAFSFRLNFAAVGDYT
jgi:hypothetical protein